MAQNVYKTKNLPTIFFEASDEKLPSGFIEAKPYMNSAYFTIGTFPFRAFEPDHVIEATDEEAKSYFALKAKTKFPLSGPQ